MVHAMAPHSELSSCFSSSYETLTIDIPVLIVGGGPAGLLQAHLLSKLGGLKPEPFHPNLGLIVSTSSQVSGY